MLSRPKFRIFVPKDFRDVICIAGGAFGRTWLWHIFWDERRLVLALTFNLLTPKRLFGHYKYKLRPSVVPVLKL